MFNRLGKKKLKKTSEATFAISVLILNSSFSCCSCNSFSWIACCLFNIASSAVKEVFFRAATIIALYTEFVLAMLTFDLVDQGCALAEPGGPWRLTFALGRLENLRFFIQIIWWAPWILQFQSTGLPSIFLRAQPCRCAWVPWLCACARVPNGVLGTDT